MNGLRIFLLDDDIDLATGIADVLELEGHEVVTASSGEEASSIVPADRFDAAFLDVKLPGIRGLQVVVELRERHPQLPVLMMTGFRLHQMFAFAANQKQVPVLRQPYVAASVLDTIADIDGHAPIVIAESKDEGAADALAQGPREAGHRILVVTGGPEAKAGCSDGKYDYLILDLDGPLLDALEVYLWLDKRDLAPATIVLTKPSTIESGDGDPLKSLEITGCLFKPFELTTLVEVVGKLSSEIAETRVAIPEFPEPETSPANMILVVEDDPDVRALVVTYLSKLGYRVLDVADANAALSLFEEGVIPDLLFSDIVLPGRVNGVELAHKARCLFPDIMVLITSGYNRDNASNRYPLSRNQLVLQKPYTLRTLAREIAGNLNKRKYIVRYSMTAGGPAMNP